jgi:hypothetical protein
MRRASRRIDLRRRRRRGQAFPDQGTTDSQSLERLLTLITVFDMRQDKSDLMSTERVVEEML